MHLTAFLLLLSGDALATALVVWLWHLGDAEGQH